MLHPTLRLPGRIEEYRAIEAVINGDDRVLAANTYWTYARWDLFFLLRYVLSTKDFFGEENGILKPQWLLDRCREVQTNSNRVLDIWARFHWKSLIKTFANVIRYILIDPTVTILMLSHTRPIAKAFMAQVQREIESNQLLQSLSYQPDTGLFTFPSDPRDLLRNSLDDGIIVPRSTNPREATINAYGLVDSMPTGGHWRIHAVDDTVTKDSVSTVDMIKKTTSSYELSLPLGMPGNPLEELWYTGTFYAHDDTYNEMIERGMPARIHPCYEVDKEKTVFKPDGRFEKLVYHPDRPVLYSAETLERLIADMGATEGSRNAALQMLCDPAAGLARGFQRPWLRFYDRFPHEEAEGKNRYILVDPANEKKRDSDYTSMWVVAAGADRNLYIVDGVRDKLNLHERAEKVFELHQRWMPLETRYERYGLQADTGHMEYLMSERGYRFTVTEVGGKVSKDDRIERLVPYFRAGRVYFPKELWYTTIEGERIDLVKTFVREEYLKFPLGKYKDMLDSLARIAEPDMPVLFPSAEIYERPQDKWARKRHQYQATSAGGWMGA